ncbi:MAG: transcriptional repressor [Spirochaetaceae bacterium]|jgi:Fur family peroxide stress response transcriptional regulator|nr:transcriptional repressor [Spirochaetaceae bacterium]
MGENMTGAENRKHSRQRDEILAVLRGTVLHPGARWVYDQLRDKIPKLSLGTVYRNLTLFRKEGQVAAVGVVNGEERFDAVTEPHPHTVCTVCGKVADLAGMDDTVLRHLAEGVARSAAGFAIDYRKTMFCGVCENCAHKESADKPPVVKIMVSAETGGRCGALPAEGVA